MEPGAGPGGEQGLIEQGPPLAVGRTGVDEELRALLRGCCSEDMRASCFGVAVVCHDADVGASVGLGGEREGTCALF